MDYQIFNEDCISGMSKIESGSVDAIICDPPFGSTDSEFDIRLPMQEMWEQFNRVTKENAAIVLFSQLPFAVDLINANRKMFRYEWTWLKTMPVGFLNARKMPMRIHENILVFYRKLPTYNPQFHKGKAYERIQREKFRNNRSVYQGRKPSVTKNDGNHYYPTDVIKFAQPSRTGKAEPRVHPTQKPVALLEYLIKTYTNENELVLDATMGSGTTGVACMNSRRRFIGFETDATFFDASRQRIDRALAERAQKLF